MDEARLTSHERKPLSHQLRLLKSWQLPSGIRDITSLGFGAPWPLGPALVPDCLIFVYTYRILPKLRYTIHDTPVFRVPTTHLGQSHLRVTQPAQTGRSKKKKKKERETMSVRHLKKLGNRRETT